MSYCLAVNEVGGGWGSPCWPWADLKMAVVFVVTLVAQQILPDHFVFVGRFAANACSRLKGPQQKGLADVSKQLT